MGVLRRSDSFLVASWMMLKKVFSMTKSTSSVNSFERNCSRKSVVTAEAETAEVSDAYEVRPLNFGEPITPVDRYEPVLLSTLPRTPSSSSSSTAAPEVLLLALLLSKGAATGSLAQSTMPF